MDIIEAIRTRKSVRKFKPDPIPKEILEDILATALRSPSAINTQGWEITVVSGRPLEELKQANIELLRAGVAINPEVPEVGYSGIYAQRAKELGKELFRLMDIAREDRGKRAAWVERGHRYFDAPDAIILSYDRSIKDLLTLYDLGAIGHAICLAAWNYGLGTCIERQGVNYPEAVRKYTGIPQSKLIAIAIAIGYPDWDFPANAIVTKREALENVVSWRGFD